MSINKKNYIDQKTRDKFLTLTNQTINFLNNGMVYYADIEFEKLADFYKSLYFQIKRAEYDGGK